MNARQNARHRRYEGSAETRTFIALMALCIITLLAAVGLGFKMRDSDLGRSITQVLTGGASRQTPGIQGPGSQSPLVHAPDVTAPDVTAPDIQLPNLPSVGAPVIGAPAASTVGTGDVVVLFSIGVVLLTMEYVIAWMTTGMLVVLFSIGVVLLTVSGLLYVRLRMRAE